MAGLRIGTCGNPAYPPALYYLGREVSITGGYVCHTIQFPAVYQGSYFFADSTQNWIERLTCDAQGNRPCGDIVCPAEGPDARATTSISATWTWAASSVWAGSAASVTFRRISPRNSGLKAHPLPCLLRDRTWRESVSLLFATKRGMSIHIGLQQESRMTVPAEPVAVASWRRWGEFPRPRSHPLLSAG